MLPIFHDVCIVDYFQLTPFIPGNQDGVVNFILQKPVNAVNKRDKPVAKLRQLTPQVWQQAYKLKQTMKLILRGEKNYLFIFNLTIVTKTHKPVASTIQFCKFAINTGFYEKDLPQLCRS
jgi:hypothetical protein